MMMLRLLFILFASRPCLARLRLVTSETGTLLTREGESAVLECSTTAPWFLCVWRGPDGLALHLGEGDDQFQVHNPRHRVTSRNSNKLCRLEIQGVMREKSGSYRCVLADRDKVETVDRDFNLKVAYAVEGLKFLQGPRLVFQEGETLEVSCSAESGFPPPSLSVYSNGNVTLEQIQGYGETKSVRFVARHHHNNTEINCRAEQRDERGVLIYSKTETIVLELLPPGADLYAGSVQCIGADSEWWCGYELILYLLLVLLLLAIVTCCGLCFCFAARRRRRIKKVIYTSPESEDDRSSKSILKRPWEPKFFPPPPATITATRETEEKKQLLTAPEAPKKVLLESCFDDDDVLETSTQMRPASQPSTIGNFYSDEEGDTTLEEDTVQRRKLLYEETIMQSSRTETITIEERLRRINLNRSLSNTSDTSILGEEMVKYAQHQYSLQDCADVSSRDLSYSQVVREHLSHNPSLNVSTADITFSVPVSVTRMKLGDNSRTQSPLTLSNNGMRPLPIHKSPAVVKKVPIIKVDEKKAVEEDDKTNEESFRSIVEKHLGLSQDEGLNDSSYTSFPLVQRQLSLDGSCFTADRDFDIIDRDCTLSLDDVKKTFIGLRDTGGGKVDKKTFINTTMEFFPKYNIEKNRNRLEKLFERLDKNDEGVISFRQFMLVTIAFSSVSLEEKLTRIFKLIDKNENGELTYEEFEEVVHDILVLKEERKMSASLIEARFSVNTFRHMGMNASGNIVLEDFVEACTRQKFILINYIENFKDDFQSS